MNSTSMYAILPDNEREEIAQRVERSQNSLKQYIAKEIRSGDVFNGNGFPKSYWHCLATRHPEDPKGRRGQWKAGGDCPSMWVWQDWGAI